MNIISRSGGIGLLVYGIGVTVAFALLGAPGGDYEDAIVADYVTSGHWATAFAVGYVGMISALGLLVFGLALRALGRVVGDLCWGLAIAATSISVTGFLVSAGLDVAMAEGGHAVQTGVPHPVIYTVTEIGNLLLVCGPAFFVGVIALVLAARSCLPTWLRAFSGVAGVCGILAPFFFTLFVFELWTVVAGVTLVLTGRRATAPAALRESLV